MNKQDIKFIRGVKGRGTEIRKLLVKSGAVNDSDWENSHFELPEWLFFIDKDNHILAQSSKTTLGMLLMEHGEELFLEPQYKYKVGDKVMLRKELNTATCCTVRELINDKGKPYYELKKGGAFSYVSEEDIMPGTFKYNIGDCVQVNGNNSKHEDMVGTITSLKDLVYGNLYEVQSTSGLYDFCEDDLDLYDTSKIKFWEDLEGTPLKGYEIREDGEIGEIAPGEVLCNNCRGVAASEKVAKSMLAMAQISQLFKYYGGEITDEEWNNDDMRKYVIGRKHNKVDVSCFYYQYLFLAFHTEKQRDEFLRNNEQLVKDYLMIKD